MKKVSRHSLRSLLTEAASFRRLPLTVVRQLVGYYGDWRRSRDVIPDMLEAGAAPRAVRLFPRSAHPNSPKSLPTP